MREYWVADPAARTVEIFTLDRDTLHLTESAAGEDTLVSSVLGDTPFPLAADFSDLSEGGE